MAFTLEQCTVRPCSAMVGIIVSRNGGLPKMDATGYSGITDDGEPVCRDHFCPTCGCAHTTAEQFEACEFYGPGGAPADCDVALVTA